MEDVDCRVTDNTTEQLCHNNVGSRSVLLRSPQLKGLPEFLKQFLNDHLRET